jgi:hypothetical protein
VRYPGGAALVCLLSAVLCGSPVTVFPYPMSIAGGLFIMGSVERRKNQRITADAC